MGIHTNLGWVGDGETGKIKYLDAIDTPGYVRWRSSSWNSALSLNHLPNLIFILKSSQLYTICRCNWNIISIFFSYKRIQINTALYMLYGLWKSGIWNEIWPIPFCKLIPNRGKSHFEKLDVCTVLYHKGLLTYFFQGTHIIYIMDFY